MKKLKKLAKRMKVKMECGSEKRGCMLGKEVRKFTKRERLRSKKWCERQRWKRVGLSWR